MAVGLPVIITGYGGALQFAHDDIAVLIPPRLVPCGLDGIDGYATRGIPHLAECRIDEVAARMRAVYDDQPAARRMGARASREIRTLTGGRVEPAALLGRAPV
jgi:glycosyltransferase involved in cell wall biosynthesis